MSRHFVMGTVVPALILLGVAITFIVWIPFIFGEQAQIAEQNNMSSSNTTYSTEYTGAMSFVVAGYTIGVPVLLGAGAAIIFLGALAFLRYKSKRRPGH